MARKTGKGDAALLAGLVAGLSVPRAAAAAGLSERTARRRLAEPEFKARLEAARAEVVERVAGRMGGGMVAAAGTLRKLLRAASESVKLGAARALLELGVKLRDSVELEKRIEALEEATRRPRVGGP